MCVIRAAAVRNCTIIVIDNDE